MCDRSCTIKYCSIGTMDVWSCLDQCKLDTSIDEDCQFLYHNSQISTQSIMVGDNVVNVRDFCKGGDGDSTS